MNDKQNLRIGFLTGQEREILKLGLEGYMDPEIANELSITERTVKEIQLNLMKKFSVDDLSSVIEHTLRNGLISIYEILEDRFSKGRSEVN